MRAPFNRVTLHFSGGTNESGDSPLHLQVKCVYDSSEASTLRHSYSGPAKKEKSNVDINHLGFEFSTQPTVAEA
jgi:hypothetical protein